MGARVAGLDVWSATSLFGRVTVGCAAGVGVCARGATSPLSRVTAGLTSAQTGCGRGVGLSEDEGASCGLTKGNGGLPNSFERPFALCLAGKVGGHAQGATSSPDGVTAGSGSACCFNTVT